MNREGMGLGRAVKERKESQNDGKQTGNLHFSGLQFQGQHAESIIATAEDRRQPAATNATSDT
jgi:hypothetical protein